LKAEGRRRVSWLYYSGGTISILFSVSLPSYLVERLPDDRRRLLKVGNFRQKAAGVLLEVKVELERRNFRLELLLRRNLKKWLIFKDPTCK